MTTTLIAGVVVPAFGQGTPAEPPAVKVGVTFFYDYSYALAPESRDEAAQDVHMNGFNVARTYLNVTGRITPMVSFRITPDITRTTDGNLSYRLKYGYAQIDLDRYTGAWTGTWVRGGIQPTPLISGAEGIYRYRFQGTLFAERDGGLSSADAGVAAHANLPGGYGDVHAGLYNGEGYSKPEVNDQKALMVRTTVRPLPHTSSAARGLQLTAYLHRDHVMRNAERHRLVGSAWFEHPRLNAGIDYMTRRDRATPDGDAVESDGWSAFVTPFLATKGDGFEVLLRYDSFRPDRAEGSRRRNRTIAGLAYWMPGASGGRGTAALMLDLEQVHYRDDPADRPTDRRLVVHGLIDF